MTRPAHVPSPTLLEGAALCRIFVLPVGLAVGVFLTRLEYGALSIRVGSFHSISTWKLGDRHISSGYGFSSVWPLLITGLLCLLEFIRRSTCLDRLLDVVLGAASTVDVSSCLTVMRTAKCGLNYCMYKLPFGFGYTVCYNLHHSV